MKFDVYVGDSNVDPARLVNMPLTWRFTGHVIGKVNHAELVDGKVMAEVYVHDRTARKLAINDKNPVGISISFVRKKDIETGEFHDDLLEVTMLPKERIPDGK